MRTYAIGDIHGHLDKLVEAHGRIAADRSRVGDTDSLVVHLGDLVDRGPDSKGVISHLLNGLSANEPWLVLKGNHDRMMASFLQDEARRDPALRAEYTWLGPSMGGRETLASYGVDAGFEVPVDEINASGLELVPAEHVGFLDGLPTSCRRGPCLFVHAGIRPGVPLEQQDETDLLWIRGEFHYDTRDHGALVVHGHTPVDRPTHYGNRVNLDSGAAFGGPLTAAVFEGDEVFVLTGDGRRPLLPGT